MVSLIFSEARPKHPSLSYHDDQSSQFPAGQCYVRGQLFASGEMRTTFVFFMFHHLCGHDRLQFRARKYRRVLDSYIILTFLAAESLLACHQP